jgi:hypothetical protein
MEKLTKWDAPVKTKTRTLQEYIEALQTKTAETPQTPPPFYKRAWRALKSLPRNARKNFDITTYIVILVLDAAYMVLLGKNSTIMGISAGFTFGMLFMTIQKRIDDKYRKISEDLDRQFWKIQTRAELDDKIRKEYENNWAP